MAERGIGLARVYGTETLHEVDLDHPWASIPNGYEPSAQDRQSEHETLQDALEAVKEQWRAVDTFVVIPRVGGDHVLVRMFDDLTTEEELLVCEWELVWDVREYAEVWTDVRTADTERWGVVPGTIRFLTKLTRIDALHQISQETDTYYSRLTELSEVDPEAVAKWRKENKRG